MTISADCGILYTAPSLYLYIPETPPLKALAPLIGSGEFVLWDMNLPSS